MKKLWQKNYTQNKFAEAYCFGDAVVADNKLVIYDVIGSIAHAKMLSIIGILTSSDYQRLKRCLLEIIFLVKQKKFVVEPLDEDVHTKVENYLTEKLGDLGKKIHTGRSRNDQVLVDLRLYTKENLSNLTGACLELIKTFLSLGKKYEFIPMPGYTHMKKAMPSSVGMWAGSFVESLIDDLKLVKTAFILNDQSPLGSGASYGVSLAIDRELTANLLGFAKVQNNSLYCHASRCKAQLAVMHALTQIMITLSRFAEDLLLFSTSEFNFFSVAQEFTTGSSIMPQKKNLDVMELLRGKAYEVASYENMVVSISAGLPSGYNADYGVTKAPFFKAIEITQDSINLCSLLIKSLKPNAEVLKKACTPEIFATHEAYQLVQRGTPFREAYKKVGLELSRIPKYDAIKILKMSNHTGGPGNLGLEKIEKEIKKIKAWWKKKQGRFTGSISELKGFILTPPTAGEEGKKYVKQD